MTSKQNIIRNIISPKGDLTLSVKILNRIKQLQNFKKAADDGDEFPEAQLINMVKDLLTANKLCLLELTDYLQNYLIENKSEWMEQHVGINSPSKYIEKSLISIIIRDDLQMEV